MAIALTNVSFRGQSGHQKNALQCLLLPKADISARPTAPQQAGPADKSNSDLLKALAHQAIE
jgi:hypothetical protein